MNTVSVAALRQNPSPVLADVLHGATYIVMRHKDPIACLTPVSRTWPSGETVAQFAAKWRREHDTNSPGFTPTWLAHSREETTIDDPWER